MDAFRSIALFVNSFVSRRRFTQEEAPREATFDSTVLIRSLHSLHR